MCRWYSKNKQSHFLNTKLNEVLAVQIAAGEFSRPVYLNGNTFKRQLQTEEINIER